MNGKSINFNISFDPVAGAMYIRLSNNKIMETIELEDEVVVDIDAQRKLVGMEFLNPSKINVQLKQIVKVFNSPVLTFFKPNKLQKAFESLAEAVPA